LSSSILEFSAAFWVVERAVAEHGDEDVKQAVDDSSESSGMGMARGAKPLVVSFGQWVVLDGGHAPAVGGFLEPPTAGAAHADMEAVSALARHGSDASLCAESREIAPGDGPGGLGEEDGQDIGADADHGAEDSGVGEPGGRRSGSVGRLAALIGRGGLERRFAGGL